MELEKQVCSLELAQRLKELGVTADAYFSWDDNGELHDPQEHLDCPMPPNLHYPAFTVAELGELIPPILNLNGPYGWESWKEGPRWKCRARYFSQADQEAETEADSRAKMLVYLLENKLITVQMDTPDADAT